MKLFNLNKTSILEYHLKSWKKRVDGPFISYTKRVNDGGCSLCMCVKEAADSSLRMANQNKDEPRRLCPTVFPRTTYVL